MKIKKLMNKIIKSTRCIRNINEISFNELKKMIKENSSLHIIDVRSPQEYAENRINSAINIPLYDIEKNANRIIPNKNSKIVLYCQTGTRSKKAYFIMQKLRIC